MSLREIKKRNRKHSKKLDAYFREEFYFLSERKLELVGLRRLVCTEVSLYSYGNGICYEYVNVTAEEDSISGEMLYRIYDDSKIKTGNLLGNYCVIRDKKHHYRFIKNSINDDPIRIVLKQARRNFIVLVLMPYLYLIAFLSCFAYVVHNS
ncbi:hypothetical protein KHM83_18990 [Fusibacter paucivorans]|uniref:Uncharacterized protein n=1 Tax=Fusibacter paucivorans TaxID=76009 RepID=A0ABS5PVY9_9FIRM|nr:hypothetical protein [Fusibacter paucivorans]MBS7528756.1 hypothetical protein [Fusibacter paucivorans]